MLKGMENEPKIFVNWLRKHVKSDKKITGKKLAKLIGVSQPTIAGYMSGRTKPNFERRQKILEITGISHKEMMDIGRKELRPGFNILDELVKKTEETVLDKLARQGRTLNDIEKHHLTQHQMLVETFPKESQTKALQINKDLIKLTKLDPAALEMIHDYIKFQLHERQSAAKKRLINNAE